MKQPKILFYFGPNSLYRKELRQIFIARGVEVLEPAVDFFFAFTVSDLVEGAIEKGIIGAFIDARFEATEYERYQDILSLIDKLQERNIATIVISKYRTIEQAAQALNIKDFSAKKFLNLFDRTAERNLFDPVLTAQIGDWVEMLVGDPTTDAPPPEKKKKGKGK